MPTYDAERRSGVLDAGRRRLRRFAVASLVFAATAAQGQIRLYEDVGFGEPSRTVRDDVRDLRDVGWNDRTSSVRIESGEWELCREIDFRDCQRFSSDERDLRRLSGWNDAVSSVRRVDGGSGLTVYQDFNYRGASRSIGEDVSDLRRLGWNDRISALRVSSGTWELCREIDFRDCQTWRSDESELGSGWNDTISSIRRAGGNGGSGLPEIRVYEDWDFGGRSETFDGAENALQPRGWNDRISSVRVLSGRWEICRDNDYRNCREIRREERRLEGNWNDAVSSLRPLRRRGDRD